MRDEKEERKKQARSNKQTRQSNTAHPRQSLFLEKMSCLGWDLNPRHSILRQSATNMYMYMYMYTHCICTMNYTCIHVHVYLLLRVIKSSPFCIGEGLCLVHDCSQQLVLIICTGQNVHTTCNITMHIGLHCSIKRG